MNKNHTSKTYILSPYPFLKDILVCAFYKFTLIDLIFVFKSYSLNPWMFKGATEIIIIGFVFGYKCVLSQYFRILVPDFGFQKFRFRSSEFFFCFSTVFLFSTYDFTFSDFGLSTFIFYFRPLSFLYTSSYSTTSDYYVSKPDFRPPTSTSSILDPFFSVFDSKIPFSTLYSKIFLLKSGR